MKGIFYLRHESAPILPFHHVFDLNVYVCRLDVTMRNLQPSGAGNLGVIFNVRDKGQYDYAYVRYG